MTDAIFEKAIQYDWVETIMFPYNMIENQGEALMRQCTEKNIGFIVMKPLAGGAIDDPELALRYICANPDVSVVIPGMYDVKEIEQNLAAVENDAPFTEAELQKMEITIFGKTKLLLMLLQTSISKFHPGIK